MGNQTSRVGSSHVENLIEEIPHVVYKGSLGTGRFFKTSLCVHDRGGGPVVVKSYTKRTAEDDVGTYAETLLRIQRALAGIDSSHVWADQTLLQTRQAVHLVRQYLWSSLSERITSRPFLRPSEKRWFGYQILLALCQAHGAGICHGDIKTENILLTSWGWVFLVDFSPYKPVTLPIDNPADFSFFFDTGERRKCSLAPERFVGLGSEKSPTVLMPTMDVFAVACVLAELFSDGKSRFEYSELLVYKRSQQFPHLFWQHVDKELVPLLQQMLHVDPLQRPSSQKSLRLYEQYVLNGVSYDFLHNLNSRILFESPEQRVEILIKEYPNALAERNENMAENEYPAMPPKVAFSEDTSAGVHGLEDSNMDSYLDEPWVLEKLQDIGKQLIHNAKKIMNANEENSSFVKSTTVGKRLKPRQEQQHEVFQIPEERASKDIADLFELLAILQCSLIRSCKTNRSKTQLLYQLEQCARLSGSEEIIMYHVIPHLITATTTADTHTGSRPKCLAINSLPRLLGLLESVDGIESRFIADYLFPSLSLLPNDMDVAVQVSYSSCVGSIGVQAEKIQQRLEYMECLDDVEPNAEMQRVRGWLERGVHDILVGSSSMPKLSLLPHLHDISRTLGRKHTADELLPALLTLFNSREWTVRATLYQSLAGIAPILGPQTVSFVLPFIDRMLSDPSPTSIVSAVDLFSRLIHDGFMTQHDIAHVIRKIVSTDFPRCGIIAIRSSFIRLIITSARYLGFVGSQAVLRPLLSKYLVGDLYSLDDCLTLSTAFTWPDSHENLQSIEEASENFHAEVALNRLEVYSFELSHYLKDESKQKFLSSKLQNAITIAHRADGENTEKSSSKLLLKYSKLKGKSSRSDGQNRTLMLHGQVDQSSWKPKGMLVMRALCHSKSVTKTVALQGSTLFVTTSKDASIHVWDTRRMERDISFRPRATFMNYDAVGVTAAGHCPSRPGALDILSGDENGEIRMWDVGHGQGTAKSSWILGCGKILDICANISPGVSALGTEGNGILGLDDRCPSPAWAFQQQASHGVPFRLCADHTPSNWIISVTNRGFFHVWDLRFGVCVSSWKHPAAAPVEAIALSWPSLLGVERQGPVAIAAAGEDEISCWNPCTGECEKVLSYKWPVEQSSVPDALSPPTTVSTRPVNDPLGLARQLGSAELRSLSSKRTGVRAMVVNESGGVIAGGTDGMIRYWQPNNENQSYVVAVSGFLETDEIIPEFQYLRSSYKGVEIIREQRAAARELSPNWPSAASVCHQQMITSLARVQGQSSDLLVSASSDGVINVWR